MPRVSDVRVIEGKKNRDNDIKKYFQTRWAQGYRYDVIEGEVIAKWGVSASAIAKLLKKADK